MVSGASSFGGNHPLETQLAEAKLIDEHSNQPAPEWYPPRNHPGSRVAGCFGLDTRLG
jgi:hypothetical protein